MATLNNLFRKLLNVNTASFNNMRIETDQDGVTSVTVTARVKRKESHRCPVCGRKCSGYDQGGRKVRRWRALDMCGLFLFIETSQERILCSEHGVQYPAVPWAYEGSRFTKDFDRTAAWLACHLSRKDVAEYLRIDWETEAERIYSSSMTLAVSSSGSAFPRLSSYEELSSRYAFNRISFI